MCWYICSQDNPGFGRSTSFCIASKVFLLHMVSSRIAKGHCLCVMGGSASVPASQSEKDQKERNLSKLVSPNQSISAKYQGFAQLKDISFDVSVPTSMTGAALTVVSVVIKLIMAYNCRNQFVKALESRVGAIQGSINELQKRPLPLSTSLPLQNLLDVLADYFEFVQYVVSKPQSFFEKTVVFFRSKSDLENLAEYDKLITRALADLLVPIAAEQLHLHDKELAELGKISEQVEQVLRAVEEKRVLRLAKKVLTNEEAFTFWCDCFPDRFQVPCDEFSSSMNAWFREFKHISLTDSQLDALTKAINVCTVDQAIDCYEVNLFFFALPLNYTPRDFDFVLLAAAQRMKDTKRREDDGSGATSGSSGSDGGQAAHTPSQGDEDTGALTKDVSLVTTDKKQKPTKNDDREQYIEALKETSFTNAWLWFKVGVLTKAKFPVTIGEVTYSRNDCFLEAVRRDPKYSAAWNSLGVGLAVGQFVTLQVVGSETDRKLYKRDCYCMALAADPNYFRAWYNVAYSMADPSSANAKRSESLPSEFFLGERKFSRRDCYLEALRCDPTHALSWNSVGCSLSGGTALAAEHLGDEPGEKPVGTDQPATVVAIGDKTYNKLQCFVRAIECDPAVPVFWTNAASQLKSLTDTVTISDVEHAKRDLLVEAIRMNVIASSGFKNLCSSLGPDESFPLAFRVHAGKCERYKLQ